jgi:hypothetical protein
LQLSVLQQLLGLLVQRPLGLQLLLGLQQLSLRECNKNKNWWRKEEEGEGA